MEKIINVFGSSIGYGAYDDEMGGWVNRLRLYLESREGDYFDIYNLSIDGDYSENLLKRFSIENEARRPDIIMIAIGMNDSQYINSKDNPRVPLERFGSNLEELIKQAKIFTQEVIFVGLTDIDETKLMPIPWKTSIYYEEKNVEVYNAKAKEVCGKNNIKFIDMSGVLSKTNLKDGLHPTAKGHEKMFQRVKNFLIENKII